MLSKASCPFFFSHCLILPIDASPGLISPLLSKMLPTDIWYARYETSVNEFPNRTIWQYTDAGTVDGITGDVCIEIAFADYNELFPGTGWRQIHGSWYYFQDYKKQTGWLQAGENWYYLQEGQAGGAMAAGTTLVIDGSAYTFGEDGIWIP